MSGNESKGKVFCENFDDIKQYYPMACLLDQVLYLYKGSGTKVIIEIKKTKDKSDYMEVDAMQAVIDKIVEIEMTDQAEIAFFDTPSFDVLSESAKSQGIKINHLCTQFNNY